MHFKRKNLIIFLTFHHFFFTNLNHKLDPYFSWDNNLIFLKTWINLKKNFNKLVGLHILKTIQI